MPVRVVATSPGGALDTLAGAVRDAKRGDPLAAVTVIVPTNTAGVMARRALGRRGGVAAVDMLTLYRLAELLGSPELVAEGRAPVSTSVVDLAVRRVLADEPGSFASVAGHPSTIIALRELHRELRLAGPDAIAALSSASPRGAEAARVSRLTSERLGTDWYDEGDLLDRAAAAARRGVPPQLRHTLVHVPQQLRGREATLLAAIGSVADLSVVLALTGDERADRELVALAAALDPAWRVSAGLAAATSLADVDVVSTTDADDEVRLAVRALLDAARDGVPFARMALLWPAERPYARLVEHHLDGAEIEWNGRPGTRLVERLVPRLLLDLLDIDRRGLRRRDLFDLLADVPARGVDGRRLHTASWERVSRAAGVARDDHWTPRLAAFAARERLRGDESGLVSHIAADADDLAEFVTDLRHTLGPATATSLWEHWADWCAAQVERWIGRTALQGLDEPERAAWEQVERVLDRLRHLDRIGPPVRRADFRAAFLAELEVTPPRQGRVGAGVTIGALAGAAGLDVDLAVVVGAADGLLPPPPSPDPLVGEADRAVARLVTADVVAERVHRQFLSIQSAATRMVVTYPRGDMRATATRVPSRWLDEHTPLARRFDVASHGAGLVATVFPVSDAEHRLRARSAHVNAGGRLVDAPAATGDRVLLRAVELRAARRSPLLTVYDGDLSGVQVPRLDHAVSPTQLEAWIACPHAYFMRYLLRVREVDEPGDQISITPLDKGSAIHLALDRFNRAVIAGELPQPGADGWTAQHVDALTAIFDAVGADTERAGRTGRPAFWADERDQMRADLLRWIDHDRQRVVEGRADVVSSERRFGDDGEVALRLPSGRSLALKGSVDRIDRAADCTFVVTDHKTGGTRRYRGISATDPTASGTRFQLPAYAAAALGLAPRPDAAVRAEYSFFDAGSYERIGYTFTPAIWEDVVNRFEHVVNGIESGLYPAIPERPTWGSYSWCPYCDPDKLGTAERWNEWDRKRRDPRLWRWFPDAAQAEPPDAEQAEQAEPPDAGQAEPPDAAPGGVVGGDG